MVKYNIKTNVINLLMIVAIFFYCSNGIQINTKLSGNFLLKNIKQEGGQQQSPQQPQQQAPAPKAQEPQHPAAQPQTQQAPAAEPQTQKAPAAQPQAQQAQAAQPQAQQASSTPQAATTAPKTPSAPAKQAAPVKPVASAKPVTPKTPAVPAKTTAPKKPAATPATPAETPAATPETTPEESSAETSKSTPAPKESAQEFIKQSAQNKCDNVNPWISEIQQNSQPVIGVLTQPIYFLDQKYSKGEDIDHSLFNGYKSFFAGTYVRWLQDAGAKVVPLIYTDSEKVTKAKLEQLNGVLMPGGGGDNIKMGQFILKEVMKMNDHGNFMPLWGTCLGFFRVSTATASNKKFNLFDKCDCYDKSVPIKFTERPEKTKMFCELGEKAQKLTTGNYTFHSHAYSLLPSTVQKDKQLHDFWDVTSTSTMQVKGNITRTFISSMEAKNYPIMATIFHPDRMTAEFIDDKTSVNHDMSAIDVNSHFGDFLINMARANHNEFKTPEAKDKALVSNYKNIRTNAKNINYKGDLYIFK